MSFKISLLRHCLLFTFLGAVLLSIIGCVNSSSKDPTLRHVKAKDTNYIKELLELADSLELAPLNLDSVLKASDLEVDLSEVDNKLLNSIDPNIDSALRLSKMALNLSEELDFKNGIAESLISIGHINWQRGDYFQADLSYKQALDLYEQIGDLSAMSRVQSELGFLYGSLSDRETAIDYYKKALDNALATGDIERISRAYLDLGQMYSFDLFLPLDQESYEKAIAVFLESIQFFAEKDDPQSLITLSIANSQLGEAYLNLNRPEQALQYFLATLEYESAFPWFILNRIARAYLEMDQLENAKDYYEQALESSLEDDGFGELEAYMGLGRIYMLLNEPVQAIEYFNKVLANAEITGSLSDKEVAIEGLAEAYISLNDDKNAAVSYKRLAVIKDSLSLTSSEYEEEINADSRKMMKRIYENQKMEFEIEQQEEQEARRLLYIGLGVFLMIICGLTNRFFYIRKTKKRLSKEKDRSDEILLNILPEETAMELKGTGSVKAKQFQQITVLFTDFKGFSLIAEQISPEKLVDSVDYYFKHFDAIVEKHDLEKIKTIGDAYMCAGGIPRPNKTHAENAINAAIEIRDFVEETKQNPPANIHPFEIRIGLNSGPVVAGVVGTKKFAYDIWGSTVNFAARMESKSEPGRINVSESTYQLLKEKFDFTYRGEIEVKNGQILKMYFAEVESKVIA